MVDVVRCRHCGREKVNRPRGLCHRCYYTPGVRDCYPSTSPYAPRSDEWNFNGPFRTPTPTPHPPGTPGKMAVLAERLERREHLFHPADAGADVR